MQKTFAALLGSICLLANLIVVISTTAQKTAKPWTGWSENEAEKMLHDSPWAQTQTDTDTSEMFYSPTAKGGVVRTAHGGRSREQLINQCPSNSSFVSSLRGP